MSRLLPIPSSFSTQLVGAASKDGMALNRTPLPSAAATLTASSNKDTVAIRSPSEQISFGDGVQLSSISPATSPQDDRVLTPLNEHWILQLENALQIHLFQHKKSCVSYASLCSLVPKLVLASCNSITCQRPEQLQKTPVQLQMLSNEERLWHDFACVVVPRLYTMVERQKHDDNKVVLELQQVHHYHGNRQQELRRLLNDAQKHGVKQKLSAKILDWLAQDKARRRTTATMTTTTQPTTVLAVTTNTALGTTQTIRNVDRDKNNIAPARQPHQTLKELEDRVRANAKERLRHVERAEAQSKRQPNVELLTVADAIFSQARHLLRQRQQTVGTNHRFHRFNIPKLTSSTTTSTLCKVSLSDLRRALPGYTHPQLWTLVQTIATKCPEWLSWKLDDGSTLPIAAPDLALISVETSNYKTIRSTLSSSASSKGAVPLSSSPHLQASPSSVTAPMSPPPPAKQTPRLTPNEVIPVVTVSGTKRSAASAGLAIAAAALGVAVGAKHGRKV